MANRAIGSRIALVRALAELRRDRTPGTLAMYAMLAAMMLLVASVPVCGRVQNQLARAHHARPSSLATWTVFQLVPKMYSFGHRVWSGNRPFTDEAAAQPGTAEYHAFWSNHYPIRAARFELGRAGIVERGEDVYLLLRSGYRGRRWTSSFVVHVAGGGLVLEPLEAQP